MVALRVIGKLSRNGTFPFGMCVFVFWYKLDFFAGEEPDWLFSYDDSDSPVLTSSRIMYADVLQTCPATEFVSGPYCTTCPVGI